MYFSLSLCLIVAICLYTIYFLSIFLVYFAPRAGDISGQIEPLLSSFDEPTPLTAIPTNAMQLKRLDEEENSSIQIDDDEDDNDGRPGASGDEDDDAKIPLLTSPEVISRVACDSIYRLRIL